MMTAHDRRHEWEAYDALSRVNQVVLSSSAHSAIPPGDLVPALRILHDCLGWTFLDISWNGTPPRRRLRTVCATYEDGLVGFLASDSCQALFSGETGTLAQDALVAAISDGCTACAAFRHSGRAKWEIPQFSTVEELQMKASISGSRTPWLAQFQKDDGGRPNG